MKRWGRPPSSSHTTLPAPVAPAPRDTLLALPPAGSTRQMSRRWRPGSRCFAACGRQPTPEVALCRLHALCLPPTHSSLWASAPPLSAYRFQCYLSYPLGNQPHHASPEECFYLLLTYLSSHLQRSLSRPSKWSRSFVRSG